jgi:hypothetical protein
LSKKNGEKTKKIYVREKKCIFEIIFFMMDDIQLNFHRQKNEIQEKIFPISFLIFINFLVRFFFVGIFSFAKYIYIGIFVSKF